jgi:hypothetical protein
MVEDPAKQIVKLLGALKELQEFWVPTMTETLCELMEELLGYRIKESVP